MSPEPQEITRCPTPDTAAAGTNTVVQVHSAEPIDAATVGAASLRVIVGDVEVTGAIEVALQAITFLPEAPLPPDQLVQVLLSPEVRDDKGRSLAAVGGSWTFSTADGPTPQAGFVFSPAAAVDGGTHAPRHTLVMDGEHPVLSWATGSSLLVSAFDGVSFPAPATIIDGAFTDQLTLALGAGKAHFGWTYFEGPGTIVYNRADLPFGGAVTESVGISPASYAAKIAADQAGNVALVWHVHPDYWTGWGFRYATSSDDGSSFSPPVMLDPLSTCADVLYVDGYLVIVWGAGDYGSQEVRIAASADNGATFGVPTTLATSMAQVWCPHAIDSGGKVLVVFDDGPGIGQRSTYVTSFEPATGTAGPVVQVTPPDELNMCATIVGSSDGKVAVARTRGEPFGTSNVTELLISEDSGSTFGEPTTVDVMLGDEGCPDVGHAPSGDVYLAWARDSYALMWSRGRPRRPCE
ncbi:hypothetical protein [Sorangium sp. So ce406]|uniref:hypothetical protein n=1 Tax=Sorangium sp. So ce406 TaxID=3133311 RepID=UPI003F5C4B0C